jgi:hypothetical protein
VITQANTSTNGYLSSTDWNTFNNKFATPAGTTLQYVDGTGALQTFPVLASADKLVINVRNSSGVSMPKGSVVYINGATGNKPTVALSQGNSNATSAQTLGLLQTTLANNAEGNVIIVGAVTDLNTSAFTEGQQLYLSPTTAGAYTATKQYAPNHLVYVGVVTRSHVSLGTIEVKVQNGYEMDELHNVSAQSPSNNDGLFYNTTTSLWEKKSIATVLGYTPYNGTDTSIKALFSASAPLSYSNGVYSISQATTASNGYLSSTDWNTFNGKESVLSFTTPLVRTINTISINQASASTSGFLSSTDWNTFNNKSSTSGTVTSVAMTMPLGLSISGSPITTSGTFGITLTAGYVIPSTTSTGQWDTAYTNRITSLTLNGSSGTATLASNVLNIPSYTLVGLGGQPALNGTGFVKISGTTISYDNSTYLTTASASSTYQTIITNNITGTGTINELAYFNTASTVASLAVATYPSLTELAYVKGVTSAIQTQLNAKANTSALSGYLPLTGGTLTGALGGTSATFSGALTVTSNVTIRPTSGYNAYFQTTGTTLRINYLNDALSANISAAYRATDFAWQKGDGTDVLKLDSIGNLGLGVTPSAWDSTFIRAIQIGDNNGSISSFTTGNTSSDWLFLNNNALYDSGGWKYIASSGASQYTITNSEHRWLTAPSGTAGTAITFTQAMTLNASGQLGIGTTSPIALLNIYGSTHIQLQNATTGATSADGTRIQLSGSDLQIINRETANIIFYTTDTERMRITSAGNVGIGTSTPSTFLHVVGPNTSNRGQLCIQSNDTNNASAITFYYSTTKVGNIGSSSADIGIESINDMGFYTGGAERMRIKGGTGNIEFAQSRAILTTAASGYLAFYGNGGGIYFGGSNANQILLNPSGNLSINYLGDAGYKLYVSGTIYATGNITANSDLTLKKNLKLIDNPIDKLMQLNGYAYQWKTDDSYQYGVIAQEVEKILPYAVSTGNDGIKGVSYNQIIPVLIEAIKVQNKRIVELESKLA